MEREDTSDKSFNKNSPFVFDCIAPDDVTFDLGSQFLLFKKTRRRIEFFYWLVLETYSFNIKQVKSNIFSLQGSRRNINF